MTGLKTFLGEVATQDVCNEIIFLLVHFFQKTTFFWKSLKHSFFLPLTSVVADFFKKIIGKFQTYNKHFIQNLGHMLQTQLIYDWIATQFFWVIYVREVKKFLFVFVFFMNHQGLREMNASDKILVNINCI